MFVLRHGVRKQAVQRQQMRSIMETTEKSFPWFHFVPHQQCFVVHRFGKRHAVKQSGLRLTVPFIDSVAFVRGLAEDTIVINPQHVITHDNVEVMVDAMVYYNVTDVEKSCYAIMEPTCAIRNLSMSVMRKALGKKTFNEINQSRNSLNTEIRDAMQELDEKWGISVNRYEIQDVVPTKQMKFAMEKVAEAERNKLSAITNSEASKIDQENKSLGEQNASINVAKGRAEAMRLIADATATSIRVVADAISQPGGQDAVKARIATEYISQLSTVLGQSKTVIVPSNPLDVSALIKTAAEITSK